MTAAGPTPEQMAWDDWDRRRRRRAGLAIGAWAALMFGALANLFVEGVLPYLQLRASAADAGSDVLLRAGLEAAKACVGMILVMVAAGAAGLLLGRTFGESRSRLGQRPDNPHDGR